MKVVSAILPHLKRSTAASPASLSGARIAILRSCALLGYPFLPTALPLAVRDGWIRVTLWLWVPRVLGTLWSSPVMPFSQTMMAVSLSRVIRLKNLFRLPVKSGSENGNKQKRFEAGSRSATSSSSRAILKNKLLIPATHFGNTCEKSGVQSKNRSRFLTTVLPPHSLDVVVAACARFLMDKG